MSRLDGLKETTRGIGVTCRCGKPARVTARGQTLCYECFDEEMGYILDPIGFAEQRMRERVREIDRRLSDAKAAPPHFAARLMPLPGIDVRSTSV